MKYIFIALLTVSLPASANAFLVKNLSDVPQTIEVERTLNSVTLHTIEPGRTLHLTGRAWVRMHDKPVETSTSNGFMGGLSTPPKRGIYTIHRDTLTIWEDGLLARQMRRLSGRGN